MSAAPAPIVFFDIAGPDAAALKAFYDAVAGWRIGPDLAIPRADAGAVAGTLREDPAAVVLYLGVPDINAALAAVTAAGGAVVMPRFAIKGVVVIGLFRDPAGNTLGFVEMDGDAPKVP